MKKVIIIALLFVPLLACAQDEARKIDSLIKQYSTQYKFSGDILIARQGKILLKSAYGYANRDSMRLNNIETEFRAGSLTKMFTATLILQLIERGKLNLDDKVSKFVPAFANGDKITIRNLLSHTSGISGNTAPAAITLAQMVDTFSAQSLKFKPGTKFEYNNFNFILLGYIAEKISGQPYGTLLKRQILDKAGMAHTGFDSYDRQSADKALGYQINPETQMPVKSEAGNVAAAGSAGALYTTVADLYRWSLAIDNHVLLSSKTYQLAFKPLIGNYGLGWMSGPVAGHQRIGHTGSIEGFMADFMKFPEEGVTIIFLSNLQTMIDCHISDILTAITFKQPFEEQKEKTEVLLPESTLSKYTGTYELNGDKMVVSVHNGKLLVLAPQGDTVELVAETENSFFIKGPNISIKFTENEGKKGMVIDMRGGMTFTKVK